MILASVASGKAAPITGPTYGTKRSTPQSSGTSNSGTHQTAITVQAKNGASRANALDTGPTARIEWISRGPAGSPLTLIAALFSWGRREKAHAYWLAGLGLAGAALVLGWFMMLALVIGATAVLIAILHVVM